jgi:copper(I)-binding protein
MRHLAQAGRGLVVLVLAAGALTGFDQGPSATGPYDPQGGVDATNNSIIADDVWLDAPNGVPAGGSAWLRLSLDNETQTGDALVSVTSPDIRQASLQMSGKRVTKIDIPAGEDVDLESGASGVRLDGFQHEISGQTWFDITLTFEKTPPITMSITAGPLASPTTPPTGRQDASATGAREPSVRPHSAASRNVHRSSIRKT